MAQSLGGQVKKGYLWTLLGTGIGQPFSFVVGVVLARLLSPADFGVIASCLIFTEMASTIVSSGFVSALIQRKEVTPLHLSTALVLQLCTGMVMAGLLITTSPLVAWLIGSDLVGPVLFVLAFNLIPLAVSSTPSTIARRNLDFRLLSLVNLMNLLVYGSVAIVLAFFEFGVWGLVIGRVVSRLVELVQLSVATQWCPSMRFSRVVAVSLMHMAFQFIWKNILNDLTKKVDYLIVSWNLGVESLGFYSRASYLMTVPIDKLSTSLGTVLFPAFSKIQDDSAQLIRGLLKATALIAMTTFPFLFGLLLTGPDLVAIVYGEKWLPTALPLQILCLAGLFYAVDAPAVSLIDAAGYLTDEIRRQCIYLAVLVVCVLFGLSWGLAGVASGVVVAAMVYWCFLVGLLNRRIGVTWSNYLWSLFPAILGGMVMVLVVRGFQWMVNPFWGPHSVWILIGTIFLGGLSYFSTLFAIRSFVSQPILVEAFGEAEIMIRKICNQILKAITRGVQWQRL